jgi:uncharacterized protein
LELTQDLTNSGNPSLGAKGQGAARLKALDLIRGIAILGILPVNIGFFSAPTVQPRFGDGAWHAHLMDVLLMFFVDGKMLTLLSLLFGAGLALQAERARATGERFAPYYRQRMFVLFLIGLVHALFLSHIDILTSYAVAGFIALATVRLSDRALRRVTKALLACCYGGVLIVTLIAVFAEGVVADGSAESPVAEQLAESAGDEPQIFKTIEHIFSEENEVQIFRHGSFGELVSHRAVYLTVAAILFCAASGWYLVTCIVIGMWLIRRQVFQEPALQRARLRKWIGFGLSWGVLLHAAAIAAYIHNREGMLNICLLAFGVLPMALAYLAILIRWAESGRFQWLQSRLRAVGRLALSNYLMQSLICGFIFFGYGFGLYGRLPPVTTIGIVVIVWALQIFLSQLSLRRFQIGPIEWLWRRLAPPQRFAGAGEGLRSD